MTLPILISNPHAGTRIPPEAQVNCVLTEDDIIADSDQGAREIYAIADEVAKYVTTDIARAIVDLNRAVDDRRADGIVKTHTCWNVPVYREPLTDDQIKQLLDLYYHPYHQRLTELSKSSVRVAVDCHTMAAQGPPVGPDPGQERPAICLSNADGTCPGRWIRTLADCLEKAYEKEVAINYPFQGGFITRSHAVEKPWMQLELSRAPFLSFDEKRGRLLAALAKWISMIE